MLIQCWPTVCNAVPTLHWHCDVLEMKKGIGGDWCRYIFNINDSPSTKNKESPSEQVDAASDHTVLVEDTQLGIKTKKKGTKKRTKQSNTQPCELHCLPDKCLHKRQNGSEMMQCSHCSVWYHMDCVGLNPNDPVGVWPCPRCRQQPDVLLEIKRAVQELNTKVACLFDLHQQVQKDLATLRKERYEPDEIQKAACINGADQIKTDKKTAPSNQTTTKQINTKVLPAGPPRPSTHNKDLLIGSSIIKDIDRNKLPNTTVICLRRACILDITEKLSRMD